MLMLRLMRRRAEADAADVDVDAALDAPSATLAHGVPVLERIAHQQVGRQGGHGVVPVAHLDGVERHLRHRAVHAIFGHLDPVAHLQHVVGRELYTAHEAHDGVLEHQHQYGGHRTQTGQQVQRVLVRQFADDDDDAHQPDEHLHRLHQSLERAVAVAARLAIHRVDGSHEGVSEEQQRQDDEHHADALHEAHRGGVGVGKGHGREEVDDERHHDVAEAHHHLVVEHYVVPRGLGAADLVGGQGDEYQQGEGQEVVQRVGGVRGDAPGDEQSFDGVQYFHTVSVDYVFLLKCSR